MTYKSKASYKSTPPCTCPRTSFVLFVCGLFACISVRFHVLQRSTLMSFLPLYCCHQWLKSQCETRPIDKKTKRAKSENDACMWGEQNNMRPTLVSYWLSYGCYKRVYKYMYIYMYIYIFVCIYMYIYIHIYINTYIYKFTFIYIYICINIYIRTNIYMYICIYIFRRTVSMIRG